MLIEDNAPSSSKALRLVDFVRASKRELRSQCLPHGLFDANSEQDCYAEAHLADDTRRGEVGQKSRDIHDNLLHSELSTSACSATHS